MFYWSKDDNRFELEKRFQSISGIKEIFIATAYLSKGGLEILQRLLERCPVEKDRVTVCLSPEFSDDHPSDILIELNRIAKVRIAKDDRFFHPKLYYIKSKTESLLIFGSSNFTTGGFNNNIEFDSICTPSSDEINQLERFINFCKLHTVELSGEHIDFYKNQESKLTELKKIKAQITQQLGNFEKRDDPFSVDTYDLTDYYFSFHDYEVFFSRNVSDNSSRLVMQRKVVQEKLLKIHSIIERRINALNLYAHWDKSNITSLTYPCLYNKNRVDWMGIRYGKSRKEIVLGGGVKESYESFTKHACLQYDVYPNGFEIVLFFAVPSDAVDRSYLAENIDMIADRINQTASKMKGYGLQWNISGCPSFNFDEETDLASYLKRYDLDGRYSSLNKHYEPNSPKIKTLDSICEEIKTVFNIYRPLYDVLVWRPNL